MAILPYKAVNNMLASRVMTDVKTTPSTGDLASTNRLVEMEVRQGVLGYKVNGVKTHRLLGILPVKTSVNGFVSAENGQVVETNESLFGRLLNKIAP